MRWIRWSYVLPRLALLAVLLLVVEVASGPLMRWLLVSGGQRAVGAKVDIGTASASLVGTYVTLGDIQITNPRRPRTNLVAADRVELDFDSGALLHKRAVANRGIIRGLRFGTPRAMSGELPNTPHDRGEPIPEDAASEDNIDLAGQWFTNLGEKFATDLTAQFQSIRLAEELSERWPQRYDQLQQQVAELHDQAKALQIQVRQAQRNPLRHVAFLETVPQEFANLKDAYRKLEQELDSLPDTLEEERRRILAAREHDAALVREKLHIEQIDSATLTAYLLRDQLAGPLGEVIRWIRWAREMVPGNLDSPQPTRQRGVDVLFAGCRRQPNFLIRAIKLQGTTRIAGQPAELAGIVTNVTNQPGLCGEPLRLELTTTGALPMDIRATIDRTGDVPRDELLVDCRGLLLPKLQLGKANQLGLTIAPCTASVNVSITLDGDELSGDVQLIQHSVRMTPAVPEKFAAMHLDLALEESLGKLNSIATRVTLNGTLDKPAWEIWSNLGPAVSESLSHAVERVGRAKVQQLAASGARRVDSQMANLDRLIAQRSARLMSQLQHPGELKKLAETLHLGDGMSLEQLGGRLPANSLFR